MIRLLGILLLLAGVTILGYQGFTFVAERAAPVQVDDWERSLWFPPVVGAFALMAGLYFVFANVLPAANCPYMRLYQSRAE